MLVCVLYLLTDLVKHVHNIHYLRYSYFTISQNNHHTMLWIWVIGLAIFDILFKTEYAYKESDTHKVYQQSYIINLDTQSRCGNTNGSVKTYNHSLYWWE